MKRLFFLASLTGALLLPARPVWACSCVSDSDAEAARKAEAIFTGTALSSEGDEQGPQLTTFAVETSYKGGASMQISVKHQVQEAACGLTFGEGERYTVFAYDTTGELETNSCWPTTPGEIDSSTLGLQATPVADSTAPGDRAVDVDEVWPFWAALSGLVFAIGVLSMWDTRRRRRGPRGSI